MADETIILKVQVDNSDLISKLEKNKQAIIQLKNEQAELNKAYKAGQITTKEYAQESVRVEQLTKSHAKAYGELTHQLQGTKSWTDKLRDSLGQNSVVADKLSGGMVSTAQGIAGMTKNAIAFVATPLGAVIAALGLALSSLTAFLKNTGSGEDALAEKTAFLRLVFEKLMRGVEQVGKVVFATISFISDAAEKLIGLISPSADVAIQEAKRVATEIAKLEDDIDQFETDMVVKRAETANKVAVLRTRAIQEEGAVKRATIEEAVKLEEDLARKEVELAQMRIELFQQDHKTKTDLTDAEKRQFAELQAAKIQAETNALQETIRLRKEIEALDEAEKKIIEDQKAEELAKKRAQEITESAGHVGTITQIEVHGIEKIDLLKGRSIETDMKRRQAAQKAITDEYKKTEAEMSRIQKLEEQNRLKNLSISLGMAAGLLEEHTVAYKLLMAARATIDTFSAVTEALPNIPLSIVVGSIGFANVAKILGIGFATGGYTGEGGKYQAAGIVHRNEFVIPSETVSALGANYFNRYLPQYADGGLVTNDATSSINQTMGKNLPPIYAAITEIRAADSEYMNKIQLVER